MEQPFKAELAREAVVEFVAGLVVGISIGMLSRLALAAWLEARRAWAAGLDSPDCPASTEALDRLHEHS
jgi:hypothetical protein